MIILIAAAAFAAAQPAAPATTHPQAQQSQPAEHKDCCKDCCKDMAAKHEGHAEHDSHMAQ